MAVLFIKLESYRRPVDVARDQPAQGARHQRIAVIVTRAEPAVGILRDPVAAFRVNIEK